MQHPRPPRSWAPRLALLVACLAGLAACASVPDPASRQRVAALLGPAENRGDITLQVGLQPWSCAAASATREVCTWRLRPRDAGWRSLARALGRDVALTLVCELPLDGAARDPDGCSVHQRQWVPFEHQLARYRPADVGAAPPRGTAARQTAAHEALEAQRDLVGLSRLVGTGPDACLPDADGTQVCTWRIGNRFEGFELLAAAARTGRPVSLACRLPMDGTPRAPGSCQVHPI